MRIFYLTYVVITISYLFLITLKFDYAVKVPPVFLAALLEHF